MNSPSSSGRVSEHLVCVSSKLLVESPRKTRPEEIVFGEGRAGRTDDATPPKERAVPSARGGALFEFPTEPLGASSPGRTKAMFQRATAHFASNPAAAPRPSEIPPFPDGAFSPSRREAVGPASSERSGIHSGSTAGPDPSASAFLRKATSPAKLQGSSTLRPSTPPSPTSQSRKRKPETTPATHGKSGDSEAAPAKRGPHTTKDTDRGKASASHGASRDINSLQAKHSLPPATPAKPPPAPAQSSKSSPSPPDEPAKAAGPDPATKSIAPPHSSGAESPHARTTDLGDESSRARMQDPTAVVILHPKRPRTAERLAASENSQASEHAPPLPRGGRPTRPLRDDGCKASNVIDHTTDKGTGRGAPRSQKRKGIRSSELADSAGASEKPESPSRRLRRNVDDDRRDDDSREASPAPALRQSSPPGVCATGLAPESLDALREAVEGLGGFALRDTMAYGAGVTHVVAGGGRTLKVLAAIATGCWVVRPEWVVDSIGAGRWLPEDRYELCNEYPAAKTARLERLSGKPRLDLLTGLRVGVGSSFAAGDRAMMSFLLQVCGAVPDAPSQASVVVEMFPTSPKPKPDARRSTTISPAKAKAASATSLSKPKATASPVKATANERATSLRGRGPTRVAARWLADSITGRAALDPADFAI